MTNETVNADSQDTSPTRPADGGFFGSRRGIICLCLLLFGLTVVVFLPSLKTEFQYNDETPELLNNPHVNSGLSWENVRWALTSLEFGNWYPLNWISHQFDFTYYDQEAWGHHLTNVLLHAANGVLLFLVFRRMTGALWRSLGVAVLFALHPLRVESVTWITERKDVLSIFFGLLSLLAYVRYVELKTGPGQGRRLALWYWLAVGAFALSLMSKSMLVTLPCLLLLLDFWPLRRWEIANFQFPIFRRLLWEKAPFFLLVVPVSIATYCAQKTGGMFILQLSPGFRAETALMGYARYLGKMFWPSGYSVLYPNPVSWGTGELLVAGAVLAGVSAAVFVLRHRQPYLLAGWCWYIGTLVPVAGFISLGWESMANRYTYFPMIGVLLMLVWLAEEISRGWRQRGAGMTALMLVLAAACWVRTNHEIAYWKNNETIWRRAIAVQPDNYVAHWCLGNALYGSDRAAALAEFAACVDNYPGLPENKRGAAGVGFLLEMGGHMPDAMKQYEAAVQLAPQNAYAWQGLASTLIQMDRESEAIAPLLKVMELDPQASRAKNDLDYVLFSPKHAPGTVSNFLATARSDPAGFSNFLAAVQFDTNRVAMLNNLSWKFATDPDPELRNGDWAIFLGERACAMTDFKQTALVGTLAAAYAEGGRFDDAIACAQKACALAAALGETDLLTNNQALLERYRAHQKAVSGE